MRINLQQLERALLSAAKSRRPDEQVPYAFEHRIMNRVRERPGVDRWSEWAAGLWRAALPCLAVAAFLGICVLGPGGLSGSELSPDKDIETALYSVVNTGADAW